MLCGGCFAAHEEEGALLQVHCLCGCARMCNRWSGSKSMSCVVSARSVLLPSVNCCRDRRTRPGFKLCSSPCATRSSWTYCCMVRGVDR
jgi:hypothetical protein